MLTPIPLRPRLTLQDAEYDRLEGNLTLATSLFNDAAHGRKDTPQALAELKRLARECVDAVSALQRLAE